MNMLMNKLISKNSVLSIGLVLLASVYSLAVPSSAFAQQYGGSPVTQISLSKNVRDPLSGNFVNNLGVNNQRFQAGSDVTYRLSVTNNGNTSFGFVDVTDTLPAYLDFVSGPATFNTTTRQLTYRIENLTPGANDTREIRARVVGQSALPQDGNVFCIVNRANLLTNTGNTAADSAQICIGNPIPNAVIPAPVTKLPKQLPATGAGEIALGLMFMGTLATGLMLRRAK